MATTQQIIEDRAVEQPARSRNTDELKVAYIMSRFPKLTETFVLYEMLALQQQGVGVEIFPLINERTNVMHEEAKPFAARARYQPMALREAVARRPRHRHRVRGSSAPTSSRRGMSPAAGSRRRTALDREGRSRT